jgi:hypothetical protein
MQIEKLTIQFEDYMVHFKIGGMMLFEGVQNIIVGLQLAKDSVILRVPKFGNENWVLTKHAGERVKEFAVKGLSAYIEPQIEKRVK